VKNFWSVAILVQINAKTAKVKYFMEIVTENAVKLTFVAMTVLTLSVALHVLLVTNNVKLNVNTLNAHKNVEILVKSVWNHVNIDAHIKSVLYCAMRYAIEVHVNTPVLQNLTVAILVLGYVEKIAHLLVDKKIAKIMMQILSRYSLDLKMMKMLDLFFFQIASTLLKKKDFLVI